MKIIGFAQLRNEIKKGNLENWFKCMQPVCDYIYIYDQNSTDGSKDYYKKFDNVHVIESEVNDFSAEIRCKKKLLEKLLQDHPDVDWIFWMDGDTILEKKALDRSRWEKILSGADKKGFEIVKLGHYNLWRSDTHYRVDSAYHGLHGWGVPAMWKNTGSLYFEDQEGLHHNQYPKPLKDDSKSAARAPYDLIHRGFATDQQIVDKYIRYRERGQTGWDLHRLIYESTLKTTNKVGDQETIEDLLPEWLEINNAGDPSDKQKIRELV